MRYLFGDSTPFPLTFDFLATIEAFVVCAGKVVRLEAESRQQHQRVRDDAETRSRAVDGLDRYHSTLLRAMRDSSMKTLDRDVLDYATNITDHATRYVEDMRQTAVVKTEREAAQLAVDVRRRRDETYDAIEAFFTSATLPVLESRYSMRLGGGPKDAHHAVSVVQTHPLGIIAALVLDSEAVEAWRAPREVGEFAAGLELLVGAKRSWFNKQVQREHIKLDDYIVSGFEIDDEAAEIRLKKKLDQKDDSLVFALKRVDGDLTAEVHHPADHEIDEVLSAQVEPADRAHLERLWQVLRHAASELVPFRRRLSSLHLDMVEVFQAEDLSSPKPGELIDRLVQILAPTSQEIAKKSPNVSELSLKEEGPDGRRREIYLRKEDLVRKLEPLTLEDRLRFEPLSLFPAEGPRLIAPE